MKKEAQSGQPSLFESDDLPTVGNHSKIQVREAIVSSLAEEERRPANVQMRLYREPSHRSRAMRLLRRLRDWIADKS